MISVEEALDLVEKNVQNSAPKLTPLNNCLGLILAEDVLSPIDMPPFDQSAMDGYAVNFEDNIDTFEIVGEIQAGSSEIIELKTGEAVRIFTGAAVPGTANLVVKQEDVVKVANKISFTNSKLGDHIRPKGEQISKGQLALEAGSEVNPAAVGFLATLGLTEVSVYSRPRISILSTGNELIKAGEELPHGKIYESNSIMLQSAFQYFGFTNVSLDTVKDDYEGTLTSIKSQLENCDLLILSGGISVGDYDFVGKALKEIGIEEVFYKVRQKPGKPILFGKIDNKYVFALPGNPAAALTAFYIYILPTLNKMTGGEFEGCAKTELPITSTYKRKANRTEILKAHATDMEVTILEGQSSAMLRSFADANALVVIHEEQDVVEKGEFVVTLLL